jgi:hypothetical protein
MRSLFLPQSCARTFQQLQKRQICDRFHLLGIREHVVYLSAAVGLNFS